MNNKKEATEKIVDFINSDKKVLLLTGTHQLKKHRLIMGILERKNAPANILFRCNVMENLTNDDFVGFAGLTSVPLSSDKFKLNNNIYAFDSINKQTWYSSYNKYNYSIIYPLEAISKKNYLELFSNINNITSDKLFLVSCSDIFLYEDMSYSHDVHVIYDVLEEDEEYHNRVLKSYKK